MCYLKLCFSQSCILTIFHQKKPSAFEHHHAIAGSNWLHPRCHFSATVTHSTRALPFISNRIHTQATKGAQFTTHANAREFQSVIYFYSYRDEGQNSLQALVSPPPNRQREMLRYHFNCPITWNKRCSSPP